MNENTFINNFFIHFDNFLSHFISFLHFCPVSYFQSIVKSLTATFIEIQLKKENSKIAFGRQSLGAQTGIPVSQTAWIRHCRRLEILVFRKILRVHFMDDALLSPYKELALRVNHIN